MVRGKAFKKNVLFHLSSFFCLNLLAFLRAIFTMRRTISLFLSYICRQISLMNIHNVQCYWHLFGNQYSLGRISAYHCDAARKIALEFNSLCKSSNEQCTSKYIHLCLQFNFHSLSDHPDTVWGMSITPQSVFLLFVFFSFHIICLREDMCI